MLMEAKASEFKVVKFELENKVQGLMEDIVALIKDKEKLSKLLENRKLGEE